MIRWRGAALIFAAWPAASTALTRVGARGETRPGPDAPARRPSHSGLPDSHAGESPDAVEGEGGPGSDGVLGHSTPYDTEEWLGTEPVFTPKEISELTNGTNGQQNLCLNGHLLPEIMVIGAIKAGTTTFCSTLRYSPSILFPRTQKRWEGSTKFPAKWKEGHYFDKHKKQGIDYVLSDYGTCDRRVRLIGVDGSAAYGVEHAVPVTMKAWYGEMARRLKFVLVMRDPVRRLHSHYYHSLELNWCPELEKRSFRAVAADIVRAPPLRWRRSALVLVGGGCRCFIEGSLYTDQIRLYFEHFEPRQFTLVPFLFNVAPGEGGRAATHPAQSLWERLGARGAEPPILHANDRRHRRLENDLLPREIIRLRAWFYTLTRPLLIARLVADTDAVLHGLTGTRSVANVTAWIGNNW